MDEKWRKHSYWLNILYNILQYNIVGRCKPRNAWYLLACFLFSPSGNSTNKDSWCRYFCFIMLYTFEPSSNSTAHMLKCLDLWILKYLKSNWETTPTSPLYHLTTNIHPKKKPQVSNVEFQASGGWVHWTYDIWLWPNLEKLADNYASNPYPPVI